MFKITNSNHETLPPPHGSRWTWRVFLLTAVLWAGPIRAQLPDDSHWFYEYGGPSPEPFTFALAGHHLYMGGLFLNVEGDTQKKNLTRFNLLTEAWERVPGISNAFNGGVWCLHMGDDGFLYVGGNFSQVGGVAASGVARLDLSTGSWQALNDPSPSLVTPGQANGPTNGRVLAVVKSGQDVYVGGEFTGPAGSPVNEKYIRRFRLDTRDWERVGGGLDLDVRALKTAANGDILAGGQFTGRLARFNGTSWNVVGGGVAGTSPGGGIIRAIQTAPDGTIYIAGDFDTVNASGAGVAVRDVAALRPNGTWNALAGGFDAQYIQSNGTTFNSDGVFALALDASGVLYAGGDFDASVGRTVLNLRHVARWDGTGSWKSLGSGVGTTGSQIVNCLAMGLKNDLYAGGVFNIGWGTLGAAAKNFARWMPARDFTGYIPGAADNTTSEISRADAANTRTLLLQTRPGTSYLIESSTDLKTWSTVQGSTLVGNGNLQGFDLPSTAPQRQYRFRATSY